MYCRKCGAEIADDAQYCNRCGMVVAPESPATEEQAPSTVTLPPKKKDNIFDRGSPLLWVALGIGACLLLAPVLFAISDCEEESGFGPVVLDAVDYQNPVTRDFALSLVRADDAGEFNIAQVCDIWEEVYERWTYVDDPRGTDYFSPASRTIEAGLKGDCDDFAVLMTALMAAIGGEARVVAAYTLFSDGHAFSEVYVGDDYEELREAAYYICDRYNCTTIWYHCRESVLGTEYWINLDWQNDHPGGCFFPCDDAFAIYIDGTEEYLTGDGDPVRSIRCWTGE